VAKLELRGKDLIKIGFPETKAISIALDVMRKKFKRSSEEEALSILKKVLENPSYYLEDESLGKIARALIIKKEISVEEIPLVEQKEYNVFGAAYIEEGAMTQMNVAARLPVSVAGALMPDAHHGYGLPIGGVLATENAIIPYGVGVDIGCRMCLSIYDISSEELKTREKILSRELNANTLFGAGKEFKKAANHEVMERKEFEEIPLLRNLRIKASHQLGSSGSGNHFVEFGSVEILQEGNGLKISPGKYIGLLSHSGSRGLGANTANHYTRVAMQKCPLPKEAKHLAWLSLDSEEGMEYWLAMNLAGDYASACHHTIHDKISLQLGMKPIAVVENHHNFAWKEKYEGREVIVHRKGATPAGEGVLGIIPGSMTAPGFIVRGKGEKSSLNSASHGAGRIMSRTQAMRTITRQELNDVLEKSGVRLFGGGLDEAPFAYKNIHDIMNAQKNLVDIIGTFQPKIVKMDG
jgi:tRNA-splicing ligase RtcB